MQYVYQVVGEDERLNKALSIFEKDYALIRPGDGVKGEKLVFKAEDAGEGEVGCRVVEEDGGIAVYYKCMAGALRGLGTVASLGKEAVGQSEQSGFKSVGIMLDCSRNAVMTVSHLKIWLKKLAVLGYNQVMLYTEETYELEGEPYFGYQRGRYTQEEIKAIDDAADKLGIELIPCIQTLGHLGQVLKWSNYWDIKDTKSVLCAKEEKAYQLIEKMIGFWADAVRSKRIHVGMDETHDLGTGKFLDKYGYQDRFELFNEHLDKVVGMCESRGLRPMIWSDMYFRLGNVNQDYYDRETVIPDEVKSRIPSQVELVYWDYYHDNAAFYSEWVEKHRELGFEPMMASGVWTWPMLWHCTANTDKNALPSIEGCAKSGVKEITFTMWGDDGAVCDIDSAFEGLVTCAEQIYAGKVDEKIADKRLHHICGGDYKLSRELSALGSFYLDDAAEGQDGEQDAGALAERAKSQVFGNMMLWDDPLLGIYWRQVESIRSGAWLEIRDRYAKLSSKIARMEKAELGAGDVWAAGLLAEVLTKKISLRLKLEKAYKDRDEEKLRELIIDCAVMVKTIERWDAAFSAMWHRRNKPQGLEMIQMRIAGVARRYREVQQRLEMIITGAVEKIDELEVQPGEMLSYLPTNHAAVASAGAWIVN